MLEHAIGLWHDLETHGWWLTWGIMAWYSDELPKVQAFLEEVRPLEVLAFLPLLVVLVDQLSLPDALVGSRDLSHSDSLTASWGAGERDACLLKYRGKFDRIQRSINLWGKMSIFLLKWIFGYFWWMENKHFLRWKHTIRQWPISVCDKFIKKRLKPGFLVIWVVGTRPNIYM